MKIHVDGNQVTIELDAQLFNEHNLGLVVAAVKELIDLEVNRHERDIDIDIKAAAVANKTRGT